MNRLKFCLFFRERLLQVINVFHYYDPLLQQALSQVVARSVSVIIALTWLARATTVPAQPAADATSAAIHYHRTAAGSRYGTWSCRPLERPAPTLFIFAGTIEQTLADPYYRQCGNALAATGYLCVSLDLPCHGHARRQNEPAGLAGWSHRAAGGSNFVDDFTARLRDVLDDLIAHRYTDPERIAACGTSRGGFMALHFAARDPRLKCVAAFAPVTDLAVLREFQGLRDNALVQSLDVSRQAESLANRAVWLVIGDQDRRVGTDSTIALARSVSRTAIDRGGSSRVELHVLPEPRGHTTPAGASAQAAAWIAAQLKTGKPDARFHLPTVGLDVQGCVTLLAIDDRLLPLRKGLCYYLEKPVVRAEPVLAPSRHDAKAPDSMAAHFYGTVLHDQNKYRMWYYALSLRAAPADLRQGPICYAESEDGIHWVKPSLGQVDFMGSKDNNALLLPAAATQCAAVIRDDEAGDPQRRYKMVYTAQNGTTWLFRTATSADGLRWRARPDDPQPTFFEMGSFYKYHHRFVVHGQSTGGSEGGLPEGRQGYASVSTDFDHWTDTMARTFRLPEPAAGNQRGLVGAYDQVHLGVGAAPFGSVVVGLYGLWHNPAAQERRKSGWYGAGLISCDLGLVISNDGVHFREPVKGHVFLASTDSPATAAAGKKEPTILCQANGILNVGSETRIYHGRWRNARLTGKDYYAEVALARLPRDRWGALGLMPDRKEGSVWSAPVRLPAAGCEIVLNADHAEHIRVEVADERFKRRPEYAGDHSGRGQATTGLESPVAWPAASLADLGGHTIRLALHLSRGENVSPRLYAVYLRER